MQDVSKEQKIQLKRRKGRGVILKQGRPLILLFALILTQTRTCAVTKVDASFFGAAFPMQTSASSVEKPDTGEHFAQSQSVSQTPNLLSSKQIVKVTTSSSVSPCSVASTPLPEFDSNNSNLVSHLNCKRNWINHNVGRKNSDSDTGLSRKIERFRDVTTVGEGTSQIDLHVSEKAIESNLDVSAPDQELSFCVDDFISTAVSHEIGVEGDGAHYRNDDHGTCDSEGFRDVNDADASEGIRVDIWWR